MKEMSELNSAGKDFTGKSKEALSKWESLRRKFKEKEERIRADLEEASETWGKLGKRFKWWQSLP